MLHEYVAQAGADSGLPDAGAYLWCYIVGAAAAAAELNRILINHEFVLLMCYAGQDDKFNLASPCLIKAQIYQVYP